MLLMQPSLANESDLAWALGTAAEDILLQQTIEICLHHPHSKPVVIMRELEQKVDEKVLSELARELNVLDDTMPMRKKLKGYYWRRLVKNH
jgi:DNA primase